MVAAQDGMSQVEQRSTLTNIEQFHQKAIRDEADERWTEAVASYQKVLAVDGSIKFAMDGKARAGTRADLDRKLNAALADPGALSSDATYGDVTALYQSAAKIDDPGPRLADQLKRLEQALALARDAGAGDVDIRFGHGSDHFADRCAWASSPARKCSCVRAATY